MSTGMLFAMSFWKGRRKDKDSPTCPVSDEKQYLEESCLKERIIDADFVKLVQLPPSLDCNEWLATHTIFRYYSNKNMKTISFFNHVNLLYGVVTEYCTSESCATMVGPDNVQYHRQDEKGKKVKQSAPQYIDYLMSYIEKSVTDESIFPTKFGQEFPPDFPDTVRKIQRYLFQVLAHVYHSHYGLMVTLGIHGLLNTLFCHFMTFSIQFQLLQDKEAEVLMDLYIALLKVMQDSPPPSSTDQDPSHSLNEMDTEENLAHNPNHTHHSDRDPNLPTPTRILPTPPTTHTQTTKVKQGVKVEVLEVLGWYPDLPLPHHTGSFPPKRRQTVSLHDL